MVQTNGLQSSLLREGLQAAARSQMGVLGGQMDALGGVTSDPSRAFEALVEQVTAGVEGLDAARAPKGADLTEALREQLGAVQSELQAADALPEQLVSGQVKSFEELAAQVKRADLTFRFSLEIRNRLVDAYREVMRMTV